MQTELELGGAATKKYMEAFKKVIRHARRENYLSPSQMEFLFDGLNVRVPKAKRTFLDLTEVKKWKALTFTADQQYLERDRDFFLFQIYTGYYFKDLLIFTKDHLQMDEEYGHVILGARDKNGNQTIIPLFKFPDLKDFRNARIVTRNNKTIVEFIFLAIEKAISFQIDDYYFPQNLYGDQLAKYYIDTIKKLANGIIEKEKNSLKPRVFDFIKDFTNSIHLLQNQDVNAECIRKLKNDDTKDESAFRYWFQMALVMAGYSAEPEPEKGSGRIDLKVSHSSMANKIIEFKGWWNSDKKNVVHQLRCKYPIIQTVVY